MKLPKPTEGNYERPPAGNHLAICYRVVDLGTQETTYGAKRQILFSWELCDELMESGEPFSINSRRLTLTGNEKGNLRLMLESWRGKAFSQEDFDSFTIESVLGKACFLNVIHEANEQTGKEYAVVKSVAPVTKSTQVPASINPLLFFSLDEFDAGVFEQLPEYYQELIAVSPEYAAASGDGKRQAVSAADADTSDGDDIPF